MPSNAFTGPSGLSRSICFPDRSVNSTPRLIKAESGSDSGWRQAGKVLVSRSGEVLFSDSGKRPVSEFPYAKIQQRLCELTAHRESLEDYLQSLSDHSSVDGGQSAQKMRDGLKMFPLVMKELGMSEGVSIQVEGAENAGKTSLIKALTGIEGEIHGEMATRGRSLLQMIHNPDIEFKGSLYFQGEEDEALDFEKREAFDRAVLDQQDKLPRNQVSEKLLIQSMEGREFPTLTLVDNPGYNSVIHGDASDFLKGDERGRRVRMLVANGEGGIAGYAGHKNFLEDKNAIKIIVVTRANDCVKEQSGSLKAGKRNILFTSGHRVGIPMFAVDCSHESIEKERDALKRGVPSRVLIDEIRPQFNDLQSKWREKHHQHLEFHEARFSTSSVMETLQFLQSTMEEEELGAINSRLKILHQQSGHVCEKSRQMCKAENIEFSRFVENEKALGVLRNRLMLDAGHLQGFSKKLLQSSIECYSTIPRIRHEIDGNNKPLEEALKELKRKTCDPESDKDRVRKKDWAITGVQRTVTDEHCSDESEIVASCEEMVSEGFDEHMDCFEVALIKHTNTAGDGSVIQTLKINHHALQIAFNEELRARLSAKLHDHVVEYFDEVIENFEVNFPWAKLFFNKYGVEELDHVKSSLKNHIRKDVELKLKEIKAGSHDLCQIDPKKLDEETAIYIKIFDDVFPEGKSIVAGGENATSLIELLKDHKREIIKSAVITGGLVAVGGLVATTGTAGVVSAGALAVPAGVVLVKNKELRDQAVKTGRKGVEEVKDCVSSSCMIFKKSDRSEAYGAMKDVAQGSIIGRYSKLDICRAMAEIGLSSRIIAERAHDGILHSFFPYCCSRLQEKLVDIMFDYKTDLDLGLYEYEDCPGQKMRESIALKKQVELAQAYFRENAPPAA